MKTVSSNKEAQSGQQELQHGSLHLGSSAYNLQDEPMDCGSTGGHQGQADLDSGSAGLHSHSAQQVTHLK